ncbi:MAG: CHAT domain-containing protein, partial [Clostridiales bacterium]
FIHYSGHITKKNDEYVFVLNNDEFFSINMIKNLDIGNPLVYLNGCISAKIDKLNNNKNINRNFEGAVLPFILAGALGVIGSLWEITDVGSKNFSEIFYNNLINGYSIGESLKKSRFLNLDNNSKDYIWASFIYYGHPGLHYNFGGSCYITKELTNLVDPRISYNVTLSQDVNWNNFNDQIIDLLNCAAKIAQDSKVITSVHLIYAFSESYPILFDELCEKYNVYRNKFKVKLDRAIKKHEKKMENNFKKTIDLSQNINYEIRKLDNLKNKKGIIISIENFIIGVIDLKNSSVRDLLKGSLNDFNVNNNNIESSNINKDNINEYEIYNRQTKNGSSKVFLECISESLLKSISYALDYSSIRKISTTDLFIGMLENKELNIEKILIESEVDISRIKNYFKIHKHKKIDRIKILDLNSIYKDMFSKNVMEIMSKEVSESILNERFISEIQILKIILSNYCSLSKIFYELEIDVKRIMKVIDEF